MRYLTVPNTLLALSLTAFARGAWLMWEPICYTDDEIGWRMLKAGIAALAVYAYLSTKTPRV